MRTQTIPLILKPDIEPPKPNAPTAAAWVEEKPIMEADVAREMQHHRAETPQLSRAAAINALVVKELLMLEIARLGINALNDDKETDEEACLRQLIAQEVPIPENDHAACLRYFEKNISRFHTPDSAKVRHILFAAAPDDIEQRISQRDEAEKVIADLQAEPDRFTEFAMRFSACPSKDQGGELGWMSKGQGTPEFDRQLFMLKPGLAPLTVESRYGHHIVWVDELKRGDQLAFDDVAEKIAEYLEVHVHQQAVQQYIQMLFERYAVRHPD